MVFGTNTVVFGTNKVVLGTITVVFGTHTLVIGTNTLVFGTNTVVFGTNTVVFGTNTVAFGTNPHCYWILERVPDIPFWPVYDVLTDILGWDIGQWPLPHPRATLSEGKAGDLIPSFPFAEPGYGEEDTKGTRIVLP